MKAKLLLFATFMLAFSTFTAQSALKVQPLKVATSSIHIGVFTVGGQSFEAWGDSSGNITELYLTDSAGQHTGGQAYSWSGTHDFNHQIDISLQITSGGSLLTFQGHCWY
jgi:hypothetical protein